MVSSKYILELDDAPVNARAYPWGVVECEKPEPRFKKNLKMHYNNKIRFKKIV